MNIKKWILKQYVLTVDLSNTYLERRLADLLIFEQGKVDALEIALPIEGGFINPAKIKNPADKVKWDKFCKHLTMEEQDIFIRDAMMSVAIQAISHYLFYYRPIPAAAQNIILSWIEDMEKKHRVLEIAQQLNLTIAGLKKFKSTGSLFGVWLADDFYQNVDLHLDYGSLTEGYIRLATLQNPAATIVKRVYDITEARMRAMKNPERADYFSGYLKAARQVVEFYANKMGHVIGTNDQLIEILIREHGFIEDYEASGIPGRDGGLSGGMAIRQNTARVNPRDHGSGQQRLFFSRKDVL